MRHEMTMMQHDQIIQNVKEQMACSRYVKNKYYYIRNNIT